jgi:2-polyprenyl-3-methyl-5-hydroxy-6-metoxy-1,4-benzoquinol methylase
MNESPREETYEIRGRSFVKRYSDGGVSFFCDGAEVGIVEWNRLLNEHQPMSLLKEHPNPLVRLKDAHRRAAFLKLAGNVAGASVADIGCEEGRLAERLDGKYKHLYCVDIDPAVLGRARRGLSNNSISFIACDARKLALSDNSIDVCLASEMLEHVPDPENAVAELVRVTRPGGRIVISVPNEELVQILKQAARAAGLRRSLGRLSGGLAVGHVQRFTKSQLSSLCKGRVRLDTLRYSAPFFLNIFAAGTPDK